MPTIEHAVREWFQQALLETVIGTQGLQGSSEWTPDDIAKALSEEAPTAAVMQGYHVDNAVSRPLGSKLGAIQDKARPSRVRYGTSTVKHEIGWRRKG